MAEVDLLDFMRDCKRLAKQALGTNTGLPAGTPSSFTVIDSKMTTATAKRKIGSDFHYPPGSPGQHGLRCSYALSIHLNSS